MEIRFHLGFSLLLSWLGSAAAGALLALVTPTFTISSSLDPPESATLLCSVKGKDGDHINAYILTCHSLPSP